MEIYLQDGDVAAALDASEKQGKQRQRGEWFAVSWGSSDQILRLAQAAERDFPDAAVSIYQRLAEQKIEGRQRSSYKDAATCLARAKETLERHDRTEEWRTLITNVRTSHKTLRALREELDALDLN